MLFPQGAPALRVRSTVIPEEASVKTVIAALQTLLLSTVLLVAPVQAQRPGETSFKDNPAPPEGRVGERVQSLLQALNSGSPDRIRRFLSEDCDERFRKIAPTDRHIGVFLDILRESGGLDFHGVRHYTPPRKDDTVVIVKDRNYEGWRALVLRFGPAPEFLITGLRFDIARTPSDVNEPALARAAAEREIAALVDRLVTKGVFCGAVLVARGEKVLLTKAAGDADRSFHVPNNVDTKFNLGSMNKMFTATAVVRLVEQGKLSYEDRISKFLDQSWLPKDVTERITVRHLLTHSSGLGSYFNEEYQKSSRELFRKLDDYKPLIRTDRPAFTPGERFQYSNTGMFLLGVIIEKVTGEDYFAHIRKVIYQPAGMVNTDCYEMDYPVENLAVGYSPDWKSPYGWQNNYFKHVIKGGPAGGGFSTVSDLHRFALALRSGKYVSQESLKAMWTDQLSSNYGFGFAVTTGPEGRVVGHSGGFAGINSQLDIYLDSGYVVAVMSNIDMGASPLARAIGKLIARVQPGS
jgi:CubicO group peptidase (beta-lactamase class C family)